MKNKGGRPTKCSDELTQEIVTLISQGLDQKSAASLCGVSEKTYHTWKELGQQGRKPYVSFYDAVTKARNQHKHLLIKLVMAGAKGVLPKADWRAASWLLEKGWPKEYGDRIAVETEPIPVGPMTVVLATSNGKKRETTFQEAQEILCGGFPIRDTYEGKSSPAPESDGEEFEALDDVGNNG